MCLTTNKEINQGNQDTDQPQRMHRYKLWELHHRYHCSVLGTCLTIKELQQIAAKAKMTKMNTVTDYELHVSFVCMLSEKSYAVSLVNKLLDKKFKATIQQFAKTKTEQERQQQWQAAKKTGDVTGAFWAIISHPHTSEHMLHHVYGDIHMLSHISGATLRFEQKTLYRLKKNNVALNTELKQSKTLTTRKIKDKQRTIDRLLLQLRHAEKRNQQLEKSQQELTVLKENPHMATLQTQLKQLTQQHKAAHIRAKQAEASAQQWQEKYTQIEQQHHQITAEKQALENQLIQYLRPKHQQDEVISDCSSCNHSHSNLCGRCVLYVGGRSGQYSHFRELVEQQNGNFIHHDGGREDSAQRLAGVISKADVVLCPLDCVSHAAVKNVKRHCKHHTKPLIFIPHASLSSFAKGLDEVASE